jgi:parallel beta-helix repeat protein
VATTGLDTNPGTEAAPWKTIGKAASSLVAGETVYIRAGVYNEYIINPVNSGTDGNYITYQAYPGEEATYYTSTGVYSGVWIDATGLTAAPGNWGAIIHIGRSAARSYIKVSGLGCRNALGTYTWIMGISVDRGSSNIILENNYCRNITSSGICVSGGTNNIIDGNKLELCQRGTAAPYDGFGPRAAHENLTLYGCTNYRIINNHIFNSPGVLGRLGICVKDDANYGEIAYNTVDGIQNDGGIYVTTVTGPCHDVEVHHNHVFNITGPLAGYGITIGTENGFLVENISIHDNLTHNNQLSGIFISGYLTAGYTDYGVHHVQIYNNTSYANGWEGIELERPTLVDVNTYDNIVYGNTRGGIRYRSQAQQMVFNNNVDNNGNPVIAVPVD